MTSSLLGKNTRYPRQYAPEVLHAVRRSEARHRLGLDVALPFRGVDIWNAWELSWLDGRGKPVIATATFRIDAHSPNLVESKSLKLYLGSFAMSVMASPAELQRTIAADLCGVTNSVVDVAISPGPGGPLATIATLPGACIDEYEVAAPADGVDAGLLCCRPGGNVREDLHSHVLRSLCPVTGQPDFGSVLVRYQGPSIDRSSLLSYIASFREHEDFHESCVERMFTDILARCAPRELSVHARYTRRGGIDINPFRTNTGQNPENLRLWRQ